MMLRRSLIAAVLSAAAATASRVVQCAYLPNTGCTQPPQWDVRWDMAGSTYTYCFGSCPLPWLANNTQIGKWSGVVGVDHYYTHQGMPCIDGIPQEFPMQDAFAQQTKLTFPGARVLEYRITSAVPYDKLIHDKFLLDPDFFVAWPNGTRCEMPYEENGTTGHNCSWPIRASAYNWSNPAVAPWFVQNVIQPTMIHGDGAWIDGDGPDNGAWMCSGSYNYGNLPAPYPALTPAQISDFCTGEEAAVTMAQQWLLSHGGLDYNCIQFINDNHTLPVPGDSPSSCSSKLQALAAMGQGLEQPQAGLGLGQEHGHDVQDANTDGPESSSSGPWSATVVYGDRTDSKLYNDGWAAEAVATFMLVRGSYWYLGFPSYSGNRPNATTAALMLTDYGAVVGNMTQVPGQANVWQRQYTSATVQLDCNTFKASVVPA